MQKEQTLREDVDSLKKLTGRHQGHIDLMQRGKMDKDDFRSLETIHIREIERLNKGLKDLLNRVEDAENYMEKYLPYNMFVQYCELLHCALDQSSIKKLRDYEKAKI